MERARCFFIGNLIFVRVLNTQTHKWGGVGVPQHWWPSQRLYWGSWVLDSNQ